MHQFLPVEERNFLPHSIIWLLLVAAAVAVAVVAAAALGACLRVA